jgi:zinc protease
VEATLLDQVENIAARPVTEKEVDEAKQRLANAYDLYLTDVNAVGLGLSEFVAAGDWRLLFITRDAIAKVSAADVNRVAAAYLKPSNRTLGRFIPTEKPDRAEIPATPDIAALAAAYKGKAAVAAGEAFDPTPKNIQDRTQTFTLGNGLKVSLLPKKTRGETVVLDADFHFGDEKSVAASPAPAASIAGAMLMMGSQSMSREQISQRFDALKTQASVSGSLQGANISLTTRKGQLADAIALAADVLRHPAYPQSEFEQLRLQMLTGIEASRKEPGTVAGMALARYFDPWPVGHPLHVKTLDESVADLKALKLDDVKAFHRNFYGTANGEIAVVGDFDPVAVKAQLESLFAGWTSPKPYAPIATHYTAVTAKADRFETRTRPTRCCWAVPTCR